MRVIIDIITKKAYFYLKVLRLPTHGLFVWFLHFSITVFRVASHSQATIEQTKTSESLKSEA